MENDLHNNTLGISLCLSGIYHRDWGRIPRLSPRSDVTYLPNSTFHVLKNLPAFSKAVLATLYSGWVRWGQDPDPE